MSNDPHDYREMKARLRLQTQLENRCMGTVITHALARRWWAWMSIRRAV